MEPKRDQGKIDAYLNRALATAREQEAASLELRVAISMARLRQQQGKHAESRNFVAPIVERFTEGLGTADLIEAKSLLQTTNASGTL